MKVVYASRTGNVESIISKLGIEDALKVEDGSETVEEDYILFTYTGVLEMFLTKQMNSYKVKVNI